MCPLCTWTWWWWRARAGAARWRPRWGCRAPRPCRPPWCGTRTSRCLCRSSRGINGDRISPRVADGPPWKMGWLQTCKQCLTETESMMPAILVFSFFWPNHHWLNCRFRNTNTNWWSFWLLWTKVPISGGYNFILKFFNYESTNLIF